MIFADIHNHSLFGCDDGAKTEQEMLEMIDASYREGVRFLCFTPHFSPDLFGDNRLKVEIAFKKALGYVKSKYNDFSVAIGNELRYNGISCFSSYIERGLCNTMNGTKYIMIDFLYNESYKNICRALDDFLHTGYIPILAHTERYENLAGRPGFFHLYKDKGVIIQVNAGSILGRYGYREKRFVRKLLSRRIADIVSSDAHSLSGCSAVMLPAYEFVCRKHGEEYAESIFYSFAKELIFN